MESWLKSPGLDDGYLIKIIFIILMAYFATAILYTFSKSIFCKYKVVLEYFVHRLEFGLYDVMY